MRYDHLCIKPEVVSLEVWFWEIGLENFIFPWFWIWRAAENADLLKLVGKCWKLVRNNMEMKEDILRYLRKQNLKIDRWVIFQPYTNFNCPYLKIDLTWSLFCWSASHIIKQTINHNNYIIAPYKNWFWLKNRHPNLFKYVFVANIAPPFKDKQQVPQSRRS